MSLPGVPSRKARLPDPANDNDLQSVGPSANILIPKDLPITQVEIEVFAALLDDWTGIAANDDEGS